MYAWMLANWTSNTLQNEVNLPRNFQFNFCFFELLLLESFFCFLNWKNEILLEKSHCVVQVVIESQKRFHPFPSQNFSSKFLTDEIDSDRF